MGSPIAQYWQARIYSILYIENGHQQPYPSMFPGHVKFLSLESAHPQALWQSRFSTADLYLRSRLVKGRGKLDWWNDKSWNKILKPIGLHNWLTQSINLEFSTGHICNICKHGTKSFGTSGNGIWPSKSRIGRRFRALMFHPGAKKQRVWSTVKGNLSHHLTDVVFSSNKPFDLKVISTGVHVLK